MLLQGTAKKRADIEQPVLLVAELSVLLICK